MPCETYIYIIIIDQTFDLPVQISFECKVRKAPEILHSSDSSRLIRSASLRQAWPPSHSNSLPSAGHHQSRQTRANHSHLFAHDQRHQKTRRLYGSTILPPTYSNSKNEPSNLPASLPTRTRRRSAGYAFQTRPKTHLRPLHGEILVPARW